MHWLWGLLHSWTSPWRYTLDILVPMPCIHGTFTYICLIFVDKCRWIYHRWIYGYLWVLFLYCIDTTNMWSLFAMKSMGWISSRNCEGKWSHWTLDWFVNRQEDETILGWSIQILTCFIIFKNPSWTMFYFVCFECCFWSHNFFCSDSGIPTPRVLQQSAVFFIIYWACLFVKDQNLPPKLMTAPWGPVPRALRVIVHKEKASPCLGANLGESRRFRHQNQWIRLGSWDSKPKQLSIISW